MQLMIMTYMLLLLVFVFNMII